MKRQTFSIFFAVLFFASVAWATVSESPIIVRHNPDGATTKFAYTFQVLTDADLKVYVLNGDTLTLKTRGSHYTIARDDDDVGGSITFSSAPGDGEEVIMIGNPGITQTADFNRGGNLDQEALETALDRMALINASQQEEINRSLKLQIGDELAVAGYDGLFLEMSDDRAGKAIQWNDDGDGFETTDVDLTEVSEAVEDIEDDVAAAAASAAAASTSASTASSASTSASASASAAAASAAAINFAYEGQWLTATAYEASNIVFNDGSSYICILAHTSGASSEPGTGGSWQTYWGFLAQQGSTGAGTGDLLAANNLSELTASASTARANIGLGTIATQAANSVAITGGSVTGITDLAIADGGTGASTASAAFDALKQAASETATGVVELATTAEAAAGVDTSRAVTAAGVAAALAGVGGGDINGYSIIDLQVFFNSGTWTKPANTVAALVLLQAGGGGGGGTVQSGTSKCGIGGGGGGGGAAIELIESGLGSTETVTIGAGGSGGNTSGGNGSAGGTSSFGSHVSATGGSGGAGTSSAATDTFKAGGAGGVGSGGDYNMAGSYGHYGWCINDSDLVDDLAVSGGGGGAFLGGGTPSIATTSNTSTSAIAGQAYGGGGSGSNCNGCGSDGAAGPEGGAGQSGVILVFSLADGP